MSGLETLGHAKRGSLALVFEIAAVVLVPIVLGICAVTGFEQSAILSMFAVVVSLAALIFSYERSHLGLRDSMPIAVLAALAACGRVLFYPFPSFKPVSAICIIAGIAFGRRAGLMVGMLAALVSNFFFGQGAWTPWQMYAWGLVGYLAGVFAQAGFMESKPFLLGYGALSGFIYGFIVNLWSVLGFFHPQSFAETMAVYAAALPLDIVHAVSTVIFLSILYLPWQRKLERIKRKYGLNVAVP